MTWRSELLQRRQKVRANGKTRNQLQGCLSCLWDMPVAFRPSLVFSAWPEARLIGRLLPGAMHSVLVTSCAPTLVSWDTLRVVYEEKQIVFKVSA